MMARRPKQINYGELLHMVDHAGLSNKEIAEYYQVSVSTVALRIERARRQVEIKKTCDGDIQ